MAIGCGTPTSPVATDEPAIAPARPNILFLSLDTVRRDALGVYRDHDPGDVVPSSTPQLDAFARDAVVFRDAVAPMPFTLASHMTMFTGLHPDVHGVRERKRRLHDDVTPLAAVLQAAGYQTVGFYSNDWMKETFGFGRGFDRYERIRHRLTYAERLHDRFFETIDGLDGDQPWFVFLHYLDAHSDGTWGQSTLPYYAPSPFLDDVDIHPTDQRFCEAEACATAYLIRANDGGLPLSPPELGLLEALYDRGIRYLDDRMGALFAAMRERDLYRDTLIVLISDHGEEFREHGLLIHSQPYVESVAIPLIIKLPGLAQAGESVASLTGAVDVLPTLLGLLDLPVPPEVQGVDQLATSTTGTTPSTTPDVLAQDKRNFRRYALYTPSHVVVYDYETDVTELFDRRDDPGQQVDLAPTESALRDQLRARLDAMVRGNRQLAKQLKGPRTDGDPLTEEERARLKSLGYLN